MGYSIKREHVAHNKKVLQAIEDKISAGDTFILRPRKGMTASQVAFQIRNILKSAEAFEDYGFAHLASQVTISTKAKEVEIAPRYGYAEPRILSDLAALEHLMQTNENFLTLTFHLRGDIEDFVDALGDEWKVTSIHENEEAESVTVSFAREIEESADSPFSILSASESTDYDEYLKKLMDEVEGG